MGPEGTGVNRSFPRRRPAGQDSPACCLLPTAARQGALGLQAYDFVVTEGSTLNFALSAGMVQAIMRREESEMPLCTYSV